MRGSVEESDRKGFVVTLALRDTADQPVGERVIRVEQPSCREIEVPTSIVLAMMIAVALPRVEERKRASGTGTPADAPSPPDPTTADAPASPQGPAARPREPAAPSRSRAGTTHRGALGVASVVSLGALPELGVGAAVRGLYLPGHSVVLGLEAAVEGGGSIRTSGGETGFQLFSGTTRMGLQLLRVASFELMPLASVRLGLIRTSPSGFHGIEGALRIAPFAGLALLGRARLTRALLVEVLPELEMVLVRDRFVAQSGSNLIRVHRPSLFAGRLSLGLAWEFE